MKLVNIPTLEDYLNDNLPSDITSPLNNKILNINDYEGLEPNEIPSKYIGKFMLAGDAIITVINRETSNQFTYKITKQPDKNNTEKFIWFVSVNYKYMVFKYIGLLIPKDDNKFTFKVSNKIINDPISVKSFEYILEHYLYSLTPNKKLHFYHIGKCCRCGKELTDNQSIILGVGPYCYTLI